MTAKGRVDSLVRKLCAAASSVSGFESRATRMVAQFQRDEVEPFHLLLDGFNPFEGGPDGDQCFWCRCDRPQVNSWQAAWDATHHNADCEFVRVVSRLKEGIQ